MTIGYELLFNGARINRMNFNEQKFSHCIVMSKWNLTPGLDTNGAKP